MKNIILLILIMINLNASNLKKHKINCDNNITTECRELGFLSLEVNKNYDEAEDYFLKACELKDAKSCRLLGYIYRSKSTTKRDKQKQFYFFKKACQLSNPNACTALGLLYSSKESSIKSSKKNMINVNEKDLLQATKSYERACKGADDRGCRYLGLSYLSGNGIRKDRKKAVDIFKYNCQISNDNFYRSCRLNSHN